MHTWRTRVDELFAEWKAADAKLVSEPEDKPWNLIRVFYDFNWVSTAGLVDQSVDNSRPEAKKLNGRCVFRVTAQHVTR